VQVLTVRFSAENAGANKNGKAMVHGARNIRVDWMVRKEDPPTFSE
jgi:hypothetical protein